MLRRLIMTGLCSLGVAGFAAGAASAELPYLFTPAKIQVWNSQGLVRTIVCTTTTTAPGCDYRGLLGRRDSEIPLLTTYVHRGQDGGYRIIDPRGRWYQLGGSDGTLAAIARADSTHGPGWALAESDGAYLKGPHWLDGYPNQTHVNDHITERQQIQEEMPPSRTARDAGHRRHGAKRGATARKRHAGKHRR